ncbi:Hypothetical protein CINCED_3A018184 [Cinara cedri]|nr:Hypothetical protein CINCED_3A018184 [Cinara cedri]
MVRTKIKRSKRLASQNDINTNQESIKKYCTEKKIYKKKNHHDKTKKTKCLKTKNIQNSLNSSPIVLNNNDDRENLLMDQNVQNNHTSYKIIKLLSPTKISVKTFYNYNNLKQYEESLRAKKKIKIDTNESEDTKCLSKNDTILNNEKPYCRAKKNLRVHYQKPYNLIPQLNKEHKKKLKSHNVNSKDKYRREHNSENDQIHLNTLQSEKIVSNEYLVEEYQVTQSTNNTVSISVKRFYKSKNPSTAHDNEKVTKDMPLISDTTFNSKADFNQSPSSKLNSSHKISLNVKSHISNTTNDNQQKVTSFFPIRRSARKTKNIVNEEKQIALEQAIASQNEDGLKVAEFPNKGRGIIADKDFARGEYVVEYAGELVGLQEARKREAIYSQDITTGCYMYYFKYGSTHYCIDATAECSRLGRLVNHSRFGNLGPKIVEISGLPRIVLVAKTDIKKGEELTYDYGDRSKKSLIYHPWLAY